MGNIIAREQQVRSLSIDEIEANLAGRIWQSMRIHVESGRLCYELRDDNTEQLEDPETRASVLRIINDTYLRNSGMVLTGLEIWRKHGYGYLKYTIMRAHQQEGIIPGTIGKPPAYTVTK